jgi:hypothetical protein
LCALGPLIEQRGRGGEQEEGAVAGVHAHGFFRLWQKPRCTTGVAEGGIDHLGPSECLIRLIAEWQDRLRR